MPLTALAKPRLSREFKQLIAPTLDDDNDESNELSRHEILYYNAFTEDLFYWDNDLESDVEPKLKIQPNSFTDWILRDRGQDRNIINNFQRYADTKLTPTFNEETIQTTQNGNRVNVSTFPDVSFSYDLGTERIENVKISKGEESNFVWSFFYSLLQEVIASKLDGEDDEFERLKYVFIDDPVSSLDESHLIELAVNLAGLIKSYDYEDIDLKFILTTHNPLFHNVLCSELNRPSCYLLTKPESGFYELVEKKSATSKSFSYHHYLKETIANAISNDQVQKFHFNMLRNLYEKTAHFLGYVKWTDLLMTAPEDRIEYFKKLTHHFSHRDLSYEEIAEPTLEQKRDIEILLNNLVDNYGYSQQDTQR